MSEEKLFSIGLTEERWDLIAECLYDAFVVRCRSGQEEEAEEITRVIDLIADSLPEHDD